MQQEIRNALRLGLPGVIRHRLSIQRGRIGVESAARVQHVAAHQTYEQRQSRHHLKVDQCFPADAADLLHVFHACDAGHHGAKDDQRNDHRDQPDERIPQRLHRDRRCRSQVAERDRRADGQQHLHRRTWVKESRARIGRRHSRGRNYAAREVLFPLPRLFANATATTPSRAREWRPPNRSRTLPLGLRPPRGGRLTASWSSSAGWRVFHQRARPDRKYFQPRESRPAAG